MKRFLSRAAALAIALLAVPALAQNQPQPPSDTPQGERGAKVPPFWVRPGFKVTLAAEKIGEVRFIEVDANGTVYVSQPGPGNILALRDENNDGVYESSVKFVTGKGSLHGLCYADGYLYFTTSGAVFRAKTTDGKSPANVETVIPEGQLPSGGGHWYRSILVDGNYLWTSIGDSENASDQTKTDRQKIWRYNLDGSGKTPWSSGIRNTEKLRMRPGTKEIYGCDHGSDNIGGQFGERNGGPVTDLYPPCEFNHYIEGFFYGHPFVTGLGWPRPEYAKRPDILQQVDNTTAPAWTFGAHWAPNGWNFIAKPTLFGVAGDALISFHGSWNARNKTGYRLERIMFDPVTKRPYGAQIIVGTLDADGKQPLARPCDVVELPDGSVLWSDDYGDKVTEGNSASGRIYRLSKIGSAGAQ